MYQIKQASADLQGEIKKSGMDIKKDLNLTSIISDTVEEIQRPLDQQMVEMDDIINYTSPKKIEISEPLAPEVITPIEVVEEVKIGSPEIEVLKSVKSEKGTI